MGFLIGSSAKTRTGDDAQELIERLQNRHHDESDVPISTRLSLQPPGHAVCLPLCPSYATAMIQFGESAQQYGKTHAYLVHEHQD